MVRHPKAIYLGDSVYIEPWKDGVKLTTEDGICASNVIYLEGAIIEAFLKAIANYFELRIELTHLPSEKKQQENAP